MSLRVCPRGSSWLNYRNYEGILNSLGNSSGFYSNAETDDTRNGYKTEKATTPGVLGFVRSPLNSRLSPAHPLTSPTTFGRPKEEPVCLGQQRDYITVTNSKSSIMRYINDPESRVTNALIVANLLAFVYLNLDSNYVMRNFSLIPYTVLYHGEWYRLLTSSFLHHGILHLLGNMLSLRWLGPEVERDSGAVRMMLIYLAAAAGGAYMQCLFGASHVVSCGSSGGVAGLFGAFVVYKLQNKNFVGFGSDTVSFILQVVAINVGLSLLMGSSLAHWSHLGGLCAGSATMFLFGPRFRWAQGYVEDRPRIGWFRNR